MTLAQDKEVRVFAPATISNLGPGFDVLGVAIQAPGDTVIARRVGGTGVTIRRITGDEGLLPLEASANTAGIAAMAVLRRAGLDVGIELEIEKGLPVGSGLGSSAASAAAAAFAVNVLLGSPLRKIQLIEPCIEAEAAVSGRHADNVAPALLGGLVLVRSVEPLDVIRLPAPDGLTAAVVVPDFELETRKSRQALPAQITLKQMVKTMANLSAFVSACYSGDVDLLARSMVDEVVTPARAALIPGCDSVMEAARAAGALGATISGAGPSIFALCHAPRSAHHAARAMAAAFAKVGLSSTCIVSSLDCPGARRL